MAQGLFSAQVLTDSGIAPTLSTPSTSGDLYANNGIEFVYLSNLGGASDRTVTIAATHACNYGTLHNLTITVPATSARLVTPVPVKWYNDASDKVTMTYDAITALSVGVFQVSPA